MRKEVTSTRLLDLNDSLEHGVIQPCIGKCCYCRIFYAK